MQALGRVRCELCAKPQNLGRKAKEPAGTGRPLGLSSLQDFNPSATELLVNLGSLFAAVNVSMVIIAAVFARKKTTLEADAFVAPGGNIVSIITVVLILCTYIPKFFSGDVTMWVFTIVLYVIGAVIMMYFEKKNKGAAVN